MSERNSAAKFVGDLWVWFMWLSAMLLVGLAVVVLIGAMLRLAQWLWGGLT